MTLQSSTLKAIHHFDPKEAILSETAEDVKDFEVTGRDLLLVVYERPKEIAIAGGNKLYLPDNASAVTEDKFQGIVGLVVKVGPRAEETSENFPNSKIPAVGDWVIAPIASCITLLMGKRTCRLIETQMVRGIVQRPDMVA